MTDEGRCAATRQEPDQLPLVAESHRAADVMASRAERSLLVDVIEHEDEIAAIAPKWRRLAEESANVFLTPEWYVTWIDHYRDVVRPHVLAVRDSDGSVQGIMPLVIGRSERYPFLQFAGAALGDSFQPAMSIGAEPDVVSALASFLALGSDQWRGIVLSSADLDAEWTRVFVRASIGHRPHSISLEQAVHPYIDIAGTSWLEYLATRSPSLRRELRRDGASLRRSHDVTLRKVADPHRLESEMLEFFRLYDARWLPKGGSSVLASDRSRAFLTDFTKLALRRGWLQLWFLEVDGKSVAAQCSWLIGNRYATYLPGFDPAWGRHSVGLLLFAHAIDDAIEAGAEVFDMGRGNHAYKQRFATGGRRVGAIVVTIGGSRTELLLRLRLGLGHLAGSLPPKLRAYARKAGNPVLRRLPSLRTRS